MNMKTLVLIGTAVCLPAAAGAATLTVVGTSPAANACYDGADSESPDASDLAACNSAMAEPELRYDDRIATLVNRGIVRFRLGELGGANADFDAVLASQPGQPDALINKAIVTLADDGDIESALAMLNRGLSGTPQRPWVGYYGRAVAHELAGRDELAYRDYRKAQDLKPGWTLARQALARFSRG